MAMVREMVMVMMMMMTARVRVMEREMVMVMVPARVMVTARALEEIRSRAGLHPFGEDFPRPRSEHREEPKLKYRRSC
jgi:hypothetical protein